LFDQKAVGMTDTQSRNVQVTRARARAAHEATIAGVELSDPNSAVIIERSRAETALRESETRFRELADNISQFAWTATGLVGSTGTTSAGTTTPELR
jgi:PAS domain-containing protein